MKLAPFFSLLLSLGLSAGAAGAGHDPKPNVLFICVDDLKPLLGCYGDPTIKSPNIDRLAARGVVFEKAFCNQAVCAPSRNALMTGMRPQSLGIYDLGTNFRRAAPDAVTLAQLFRQNGYRTEALGKIFHVGHGNHEDPASWTVPHWQARTVAYALPENRASSGLTREEARFENAKGDPNKLPRGAAYECADVPDATYGDGLIAEEAMRRLRAVKAKPTEPFFLAIGFLKPHLPFCAPKKYWDLYDRATISLPARRTPPDGAPAFAPTGWGELRQYSDIPETGPLTDEKARTLIHGYRAAVSYMDAQLGRVLDELDALGLASNTIILLWGDHGWHLGDHGMWCKHTNYEQATRLPLLVVAPGVARPGAHTTALAETVDIYPTLAELAGLSTKSVAQKLDGRSLVPLLRDPAAAGKEFVTQVYPRRVRGSEWIGRAVRTARYRLVEWKKPGAPANTAILELYDYQADPDETKNLAAEQPELAARIQGLLASQPEAKPQWQAPPGARADALPRLKWADRSRLGRPFAKDPSVIRFGGRYLMYFSLPPFSQQLAPTNAPDGWSIGIAESRNLVDWRTIGELWPAQECDQNGLCAPGARVLDGKVHLFYQTYGNGPKDAICHAVSEDGVTFQRDASNPVFRPAGPWNSGRAIDAEVFPHGDQLLLYFATRDPMSKTQMLGVAAAPLKSGFSRDAWRQLCDGPILRPELPWETRCIEAPTLARRGDTLVMFYAGGYNNDPQQIGVATSTNGVHWTRLSDTPLVPNGELGDWNYSESGHPGYFADDDGRSYLFFQGNNDKGRTWLLSAVEIGWTNSQPLVLWNSTKLPAKRLGIQSPASPANASRSP